MGCGELKKMKLRRRCGNRPREAPAGGGRGVSGLTAAWKRPGPATRCAGGKIRQARRLSAELHRRMPFREPYAEPQDTGMAELVKAVTPTPHQSHHQCGHRQTDGAPGRFKVDISVESDRASRGNRRIIQATVFHLRHRQAAGTRGGKSPNVIDQAGLERLAKEAAAKGQPIRGHPTAAK